MKKMMSGMMNGNMAGMEQMMGAMGGGMPGMPGGMLGMGGGPKGKMANMAMKQMARVVFKRIRRSVVNYVSLFTR